MTHPEPPRPSNGSSDDVDDSPGLAAGERAGDVIDRYTLIQPLGDGGMGTVWEAQQSEPVSRRVALKIIKLGMDTQQVVARFEAERQALALMDHPHIAKVLDGGATQAGRPYFVMELVRGAPITEYCQNEQTSLQGRLELFVQVCQALQHAHQKGIVHRDVKPSNVLVTLHDGTPVPKVIDFGIAKATGGQLTDNATFTQFGQIIGTPEYMAPEQASQSAVDIDTRADVYSLGVLLFELLTGTKPFDITRVLEKGYMELLRTIRETEAPRPSTRASTLEETATSNSETNFALRTSRLATRLKGDLDWIVLKAMEKDRTQRYPTASSLADDVQRHLDGEPVHAHPPSGSYRLSKFIKRRKKTVAAIAIIAFLLVAGSTGTGFGWYKTQQANDALAEAITEKETQRGLAVRAAEEADAARKQAIDEADRARRAEADAKLRTEELTEVSEFRAAQLKRLDPQWVGVRLRQSLVRAADSERLDTLNDGLIGVNFTDLAMTTLEESLFEQSIDAIDEQFANRPLIRASLLQTLAETISDLGLMPLAIETQTRVVALREEHSGPESERTYIAVGNLGELYLFNGQASLAEPHLQRAAQGLRELLGDDPITLTAVHTLGKTLLELGQTAEAEALLVEALDGRRQALGNDHHATLVSISSMGWFYENKRDYERAEEYYREALEGRRASTGRPSDLLTPLQDLGMLLAAQRRTEEAEPYLREALEISTAALGEDHPNTISSISGIGYLYTRSNAPERAEPYFREALERAQRALGEDHATTLTVHNDVGHVCVLQGNLEEAELHVQAALRGYTRLLGDDNITTLILRANLANLLQRQGKIDEAAAHYRETLEASRRSLGDDHPDTLTVLHELGSMFVAHGRPREAEPYLAEAFERSARVLGTANPETQHTLELLNSTRPEEP